MVHRTYGNLRLGISPVSEDFQNTVGSFVITCPICAHSLSVLFTLRSHISFASLKVRETTYQSLLGRMPFRQALEMWRGLHNLYTYKHR